MWSNTALYISFPRTGKDNYKDQQISSSSQKPIELLAKEIRLHKSSTKGFTRQLQQIVITTSTLWLLLAAIFETLKHSFLFVCQTVCPDGVRTKINCNPQTCEGTQIARWFERVGCGCVERVRETRGKCCCPKPHEEHRCLNEGKLAVVDKISYRLDSVRMECIKQMDRIKRDVGRFHSFVRFNSTEYLNNVWLSLFSYQLVGYTHFPRGRRVRTVHRMTYDCTE